MALPQGGVQKGHSPNAKSNPDGKHVMDEILTSPYAGPFEIKKSAPLRTKTKELSKFTSCVSRNYQKRSILLSETTISLMFSVFFV